MTKEERIQKQKERLEEMKKAEAKLHGQGYKYIAGVDEVGRGPLAGPVVAAAVILPEDFHVLGVDDSKKLSEKRRETLYDEIIHGCVAYGIGMENHKTIDEINILQATKRAMKRALVDCENKLMEIENQKIDYVLLDAVKLDNITRPQESFIKGDSKVLAIAAASIVAKVTRDKMMVEYAEKYPGYSFEKNKGYGTAAHYAGIRQNGTCPIHRVTFLKTIH